MDDQATSDLHRDRMRASDKTRMNTNTLLTVASGGWSREWIIVQFPVSHCDSRILSRQRPRQLIVAVYGSNHGGSVKRCGTDHEIPTLS